MAVSLTGYSTASAKFCSNFETGYFSITHVVETANEFLLLKNTSKHDYTIYLPLCYCLQRALVQHTLENILLIFQQKRYISLIP